MKLQYFDKVRRDVSRTRAVSKMRKGREAMIGTWAARIRQSLSRLGTSLGFTPSHNLRQGNLEEGWVIANHKLVSFHAAFLSSLFMLTKGVNWDTGEVLKFMFSPLSIELWFSALILYLSWHINIGVHEMGHYIAAVKTSNLRPELLAEGEKNLTPAG